MATMLQVKLGALILVVGAVAVAFADDADAGNSTLCDYRYSINTPEEIGAGTDAYVLVGIYAKDGRGWKISRSGSSKKYEQGGLDVFFATRECLNPCRLTLSISGGSAGSAWYPEFVIIQVFDHGSDELKYSQPYAVKQWVYEGYPIEILNPGCRKWDSSSVI
jgi:hypothetical protein